MSFSVSNTNISKIEKAGVFYELLKPRLSFLVVFSSGFGYLLASPLINSLFSFIAFLIAGFLVSGASAVINQIIEKEYDGLMRYQRRKRCFLALLQEYLGWC